MNRPPMQERIAAALGADPELAFELFLAACEICDDFDDYGPVLQADEYGDYSSGTAIARLREMKERVKAVRTVRP